MLYRGEFSNINNDIIRVDIATQNDTTNTTELLLASDSVVITTNSDGIFSPLKANACTITILTNMPYSDMYSSAADDVTVTVSNITKGTTLFRGYLTSNIYNQEYEGEADKLELEAISAISALKHHKFERLEKEEIINWYVLIKRMLTKVGYHHFYFPTSYRINEKSGKEMLKTLYQFTENFIDDDDERTPWKLSEIIEEFCKYFCLSMTVYNDEIYFIDYLNHGEYLKYNLDDDTVTSIITTGDNYTINGDSYRSNITNISMDDTYNKIEAKANLYEVREITSDPFNDDDLINQNADKNKFYEKQETFDKKEYTVLNAYFDSKSWETVHAAYGEITPNNLKDIQFASFFQKCEDYPTEEEPSSLRWETYLTAYKDGSVLTKDVDFCITRPLEEKYFIANGGYFVVNLDYKFSNNISPNSVYVTSDQTYADSKYNVGLDDTLFPCRLYVGQYYFDGQYWTSKKEFDRKTAKGYYQQYVYCATFSPTPTWYKYRDADGDWKFTIDKAEWDAATTEKESGRSNDTNRVYYYIDDTNQKIWIDQDYYLECILKDRFYLVHKNKEGEKIFDEMKSLTNTVSWRMNMVDSEDGVAIKLPKFVLHGKVKFDIYAPNYLGKLGQFTTAPHDSGQEIVKAVHINRLDFVYKASGDMIDIFADKVVQDDVVYTNVINESYVNEFDELELKINTQVENRITSTSSMLYLPANSDYYTFLYDVYDNIYKKYREQEHNLVQRYYEHYMSPKLIFIGEMTNVFTPFTRVRENNLNKTMIVDSMSINVDDDTAEVKLIEM